MTHCFCGKFARQFGRWYWHGLVWHGREADLMQRTRTYDNYTTAR